jgi:hypothetical protein
MGLWSGKGGGLKGRRSISCSIAEWAIDNDYLSFIKGWALLTSMEDLLLLLTGPDGTRHANQ